MMLIHLIKKDFLIIKKYVLIMAAAAIVIPLFIYWRLRDIPEAEGFAAVLGYVLSVIFTSFILLQYMSMAEAQSPLASVLLCTTPYPRRLLVLSKYCFCLIIFTFCTVVFGIETLIFPQLGPFDIKMPIGMFVVISLLFGIYLPVQYKLGYEKTKLFFIIVVLAFPFLMPQLLKMNPEVILRFINARNPLLLYGSLLFVSIVILCASAYISVKIYNKGNLK